MGARGPAPTPTAILDIRGSWRAKTRAGEPQPQRGAPTAPRSLSKIQKAVFRQVCRILEDMGLATTADGAQLERYAIYLVRWRACETFLAAKDAEHAAKGHVVPPGCYPVWSDDADTYVSATTAGVCIVGFVEYPAVRESHRLDLALKQIEASFGLTPSARARLTVGGADNGPADPIAEFLNAKRA
jgi:P27 family predicted phage terminase small subunit